MFKLIKFVIVTRFSKPLLVFLILLFIYNFIVLGKADRSLSEFFTYYGIGIIAFVLSLSVLASGLAFLKSDRDYLLLLPLPRIEIAVSLFIAQFISYGLMIISFFGYSFAFFIKEQFIAEYAFGLICIALSAASLSAISYRLELGKRLAIALSIIAWVISPIIGLPLSPSTLYSQDPLLGVIASLLLAIITVPIAIKELKSAEFGLFKATVLLTSQSSINQRSFIGMKPIRSIYHLNFSRIEIGGRIAMFGGSSTFGSRGVSLWSALSFTALLALLYLYLIFTILPANSHNEAPIAIADIYIVSIIPALFAFPTLGNERLWLGFTSIEPNNYLRHLIIARALAILVILLPFSIADISLGLIGHPLGFTSALLTALIPASGFIWGVYIMGLTSPVQIREEISMAGQLNLRQLIFGIIIGLLVSISYISFISIYLAIICSMISLIVAIMLLMSKSISSRVIKKMVENGFV